MGKYERLTIAICNYVQFKGDAPIQGKYVDYAIDKQWRMAINGKDEPVTPSDREDSMGGVEMKMGDVQIWFNGWMAGIFCIIGDGVIANGEAANIETFITALEDAS